MSTRKPGRPQEFNDTKIAVIKQESTETTVAPQLIDLTVNILCVNGTDDPDEKIVIDCNTAVHPIALKYFASKGLEVTQDLEHGKISIKYNAPTGTSITTKEYEQFAILEIVNEDFNDLFEDIIKLAVDQAFNEQLELEQLEPSSPIAIIQPIRNSDEMNPPLNLDFDYQAEMEPVEEPGIFTRFSNGCTYYFNSAYNAVFGASAEPEATQQSAPKPSPSPMP